MNENKDKYKMFKNFMHNELEISRDDIKQWVKDTIKEEVSALCKNIDIYKLISDEAKKLIQYRTSNISENIGKELAKQINIKLIKEVEGE